MTIIPDGVLSKLVLSEGVANLDELIDFVNRLPYGRNSNRDDFSLVIKEGRGSCSSKHALVKAVAIEQQWNEVKLMLGIYKMNGLNTPGIGSLITEAQLDFIPEAHCYLNIKGNDVDITFPGEVKMDKEILIDLEIVPDQVKQFKVDFHQKYIKKWITAESIPFSFETIWKVREKCIARLSQMN